MKITFTKNKRKILMVLVLFLGLNFIGELIHLIQYYCTDIEDTNMKTNSLVNATATLIFFSMVLWMLIKRHNIYKIIGRHFNVLGVTLVLFSVLFPRFKHYEISFLEIFSISNSALIDGTILIRGIFFCILGTIFYEDIHDI